MWRRAAVVLLASLAGCGGEEPREALSGWSRSTDADCRRAAADVASIPRPPVTLEELAQVAPAVSKTFDQTAKRIERRTLPEDGRPRADPFLRDLNAVRTEFRRLGDAARHGDTEATSNSVKVVAKAVPRLERSAKEAGAPRCGDRKGLTAVLDGVRGAIFVHFLPRITEDAAAAAATALEGAGERSLAVQADSLADAENAVDDAHTRISGLDAPTWANKTVDEYLNHLLDLSEAMTQIWDALDSVRIGALSRSEVRGQARRGLRRLVRAGAAEQRAARKLERLMRERLLRPDPAAGAIGSLA